MVKPGPVACLIKTDDVMHSEHGQLKDRDLQGPCMKLRGGGGGGIQEKKEGFLNHIHFYKTTHPMTHLMGGACIGLGNRRDVLHS